MKAFTDADFDYLYNAGAGKTCTPHWWPTHRRPAHPARSFDRRMQGRMSRRGSGGGGYVLVMDAGKLGIEVGPLRRLRIGAPRRPSSVDSHWYALAFVIEAGVPHIYRRRHRSVGGIRCRLDALTGIDTTRTDYPLRIGASGNGRRWRRGAHIDELSVMIGTAAYTANYTPESAAFPLPIRRKFRRHPDPDARPRARLGCRRRTVRRALCLAKSTARKRTCCARAAAADHKVVLLEAAPFDLFGKGEHQEQTRVAFGTLDNIVRDWICVSAAPSSQTQIKVDGLIYNPDVYDGAMPHQGAKHCRRRSRPAFG